MSQGCHSTQPGGDGSGSCVAGSLHQFLPSLTIPGVKTRTPSQLDHNCVEYKVNICSQRVGQRRQPVIAGIRNLHLQQRQLALQLHDLGVASIQLIPQPVAVAGQPCNLRGRERSRGCHSQGRWREADMQKGWRGSWHAHTRIHTKSAPPKPTSCLAAASSRARPSSLPCSAALPCRPTVRGGLAMLPLPALLRELRGLSSSLPSPLLLAAAAAALAAPSCCRSCCTSLRSCASACCAEASCWRRPNKSEASLCRSSNSTA